MNKSLLLEIVTPERVVLSAEISSVVVPATEGYLGIRPNHAPLITGLEPGVIKYVKDGQEYFIAISTGFLEVAHNKVSILADTAERPDEIDEERARRAAERADRRLHERYPGLDVAKAEFALRRARARLKTLEYSHARRVSRR